MDIYNVGRAYWYELSIAATLIYVLAAPALAARVVDLRIVAAFPIIGQTTTASFCVVQLLRAAEAFGVESAGPRTIAAGLAEALFVWSIGAAASAVSGILIVTGIADARESRTTGGSITLIAGAAASAALLAVMWRVWTGSWPGPPEAAAAAVALAISAFSLLAATLSIVWPWDRSRLRAGGGRWMWIFAGCCGAAAALMLVVSVRLTAFAARPYRLR